MQVKFLKNRNRKKELEYKNCKKLFESIKKRAKKNYFSSLILKHKNNIKKTWDVIKESIGDVITKTFIQKKTYQVKKLLPTLN